MARIEARLEELGLVLPAELSPPPGVVLPFPWVNVRGDRVFVSGHGPQEGDGSIAGPFGQLGAEVTIEDPEVFTEPWQMRMPLYRRQEEDLRILDYECYALADDASPPHRD